MKHILGLLFLILLLSVFFGCSPEARLRRLNKKKERFCKLNPDLCTRDSARKDTVLQIIVNDSLETKPDSLSGEVPNISPGDTVTERSNDGLEVQFWKDKYNTERYKAKKPAEKIYIHDTIEKPVKIVIPCPDVPVKIEEKIPWWAWLALAGAGLITILALWKR